MTKVNPVEGLLGVLTAVTEWLMERKGAYRGSGTRSVMAAEAWGDRMVTGVAPLWHKARTVAGSIVAAVRKRQPQRECCHLKSQVSRFLQLRNRSQLSNTMTPTLDLVSVQEPGGTFHM